MSRVLVTGGAGTIGTAVVKRLLADPDYEVRVSDRRAAPQWMREGCEIHSGDLRVAAEARAAAKGCSEIIHLAAIDGGRENAEQLPHTLLEADNALVASVIRAALDSGVERFVYVSCASVFERTELFPTPEEHLPNCPTPLSAHGFSNLIGEMYCRAAYREHALPYTICRPFDVYGPGEPSGGVPGAGPDAAPDAAHLVADLIERALAGQRPLALPGSGEQTRTLTHVEDVADGLVTAMGSPAALAEDFNLAGARELSVAEIARIVWETCGEDPDELEFEHLPASAEEVQRRCPAVEKARKMLGWEAKISVEDGIAATVRRLRERRGAAATGASSPS